MSLASQTLFTATGFPKIGLAASIASGLTNVVLDILFMGPLQMGMRGAALATVISWAVAMRPRSCFSRGKARPFSCTSPFLN